MGAYSFALVFSILIFLSFSRIVVSLSFEYIDVLFNGGISFILMLAMALIMAMLEDFCKIFSIFRFSKRFDVGILLSAIFVGMFIAIFEAMIIFFGSDIYIKYISIERSYLFVYLFIFDVVIIRAGVHISLAFVESDLFFRKKYFLLSTLIVVHAVSNIFTEIRFRKFAFEGIEFNLIVRDLSIIIVILVVGKFSRAAVVWEKLLVNRKTGDNEELR